MTSEDNIIEKRWGRIRTLTVTYSKLLVGECGQNTRFTCDQKKLQTMTCPSSNTNTDTWLGDRNFAVTGPRRWNNLPVELRQRDICLSEFRRLLKTFLFCWESVSCDFLFKFAVYKYTYLLTYLLTYLHTQRETYTHRHRHTDKQSNITASRRNRRPWLAHLVTETDIETHTHTVQDRHRVIHTTHRQTGRQADRGRDWGTGTGTLAHAYSQTYRQTTWSNTVACHSIKEH